MTGPQGPWLKYQQQAPPAEQTGPWTKYASPSATAALTPPASAPDPHPYLHAAENAVKGAANTISQGYVGALKGAGQTATGIGKLLLMGSGPSGIGQLAADEAVPNSGLRRIAQKLQPVGAPQKIGSAAENVAETYLLPLVGEADLPLRLGAQALMGAGLSKAHGGSALAGAVGGGGAELLGSGVRALAPTLAEAGIGARAVDRAYDKTPGLALLNDTRGLRPAKIAATSRESLGRLNSEIDQMAADASRPTVMGGAPARLALPPGPVEREAVPLHQATAVVERPSILQPAARPIVRDGSFTTSPATLNIPGATSGRIADFARMQTPAENQAVAFLDRLGAEGENGITYPQGKMPPEAVAHPLHEPLRTIRREETAQGVWLRTPEGPIHVAPTTPEQAGFTLHQPTVSLRPALDRLDEMIAKVPENSPTELNSLQKVRGGLTTNLQGEQIPADVSPARALALKRGLRREFAKYRGDPTFDANVASNASKEASHDIDTVLDRALGPQFASKNQRISSLIDVNKLASRASRNAPLGQRIAGRLAAHTGALTGAGIGSVLGYRKGGLEGAAAGGAAGLLLPEALASRPAWIGTGRALYSPVTTRLLRGALVGGATAATKH